MSTNLTATLPGLAFSSVAATGFTAAPTMPIAALAWSAEQPADEPPPPAPAVRTRPVTRSTPAVVAATLFGAVTVVATLGAIMFGGNGSPEPNPAVVDRTESAPYVPVIAAPTPSLSQAVVPEQLTIPVPVAAKTRPIAVPLDGAPQAGTTGGDAAQRPENYDRRHFTWGHRNWGHHDQH
ncbi:hypothetical protein ABIA30_001656 [Mycobacterium sp. MAA66]|uniref:hypothetical protein n=1 Tax=Mycobacterium sp. MAA66 TaxID=3156297 RepID=UPI00351354B6